jgi:hypothetical protein
MVCGLSVAAYMYSVDRYALLYYGDAVSHLVGSRKLFDWAENPGLGQIGTVWLPLPHVLLSMPSIVDELFFTGFAGLAVSLPSLAFASVFLYKILPLVLGKIPLTDRSIIPYAGFAGALLYALNPNFLYLGITAMTEAPFMLFFTSSVYYLLKWHDLHRRFATTRVGLKYLTASSILVCAATLSRYEGWILPLFIIGFVILFTFSWERKLKGRVEAMGTVEGFHDHSRIGNPMTIVSPVLVSLLSLSGMVLWLVYNAANYGDPLEFANLEYYSAASQALNRPFRESLFLQPANVFGIYGATAAIVYGPVLLSGLLGFILHSRIKGEGRDLRKYSLVLLVLPAVFTLALLLVGIGEMGFWFNSRFVILLSPILIILTATYILTRPGKIVCSRVLLIGIIASMFVFYTAIPAFGAVVTLADAKAGFQHKQSPYSVETGEKLGTLYDGEGSILIMTGSALEHRILLASRIPLKHYDEVLDSSMWKESFQEPWRYNDRWVVIGKEPSPDAARAVQYWVEHREELDEHYLVIYENDYYEILKLR